MRKYIFLIIFLLIVTMSRSQLYIAPGAQFSLTGNAILGLDNMSLNNNGQFEAANSLVSFKGNTLGFIQGTEVTSFYDLQINKTGGSQVILNRNANVMHHLYFSGGNLELLSFILGLGQTGSLIGESENSRITGFNGQVQAARVLNAPLNENIGNLGATITSTQNLGLVRVYRKHQGINVTGGLVSPVYRHYQIIPAQNTGAGAELRFHYFDAELNGNTENNLSLYQRTAPATWANIGFSARDAVNNIVAKTNLDSLGWFTISSANMVLPVRFSLFNTRCENGNVMLTWHTSSEHGSQRFAVQGSTDGSRWREVGSVPAAGFSTTPRVYNFMHNNAPTTGYYRLAEYSVDGRIQYSAVLRSSCDEADKFLVWPNPTVGKVSINFSSRNASAVTISVYNAKGALVKEQRATVLSGSNQLPVDLSSLSTGMYTIVTEGAGTKNSTKVYKQ